MKPSSTGKQVALLASFLAGGSGTSDRRATSGLAVWLRGGHAAVGLLDLCTVQPTASPSRQDPVVSCPSGDALPALLHRVRQRRLGRQQTRGGLAGAWRNLPA